MCVSVSPELLYQDIDMLIRPQAKGRDDFDRGRVEEKRADKTRAFASAVQCAVLIRVSAGLRTPSMIRVSWVTPA